MNLTAFEEKVVEHILQSSAPGKHAARSALRHLERAWKLVDEMPELAMFSAITAEEESAAALFHRTSLRSSCCQIHLLQKFCDETKELLLADELS